MTALKASHAHTRRLVGYMSEILLFLRLLAWPLRQLWEVAQGNEARAQQHFRGLPFMMTTLLKAENQVTGLESVLAIGHEEAPILTILDQEGNFFFLINKVGVLMLFAAILPMASGQKAGLNTSALALACQTNGWLFYPLFWMYFTDGLSLMVDGTKLGVRAKE